jgi:hypothetical protein
MTMIRNNDGPTLAPNTAEESRYSAHLNQGTPVATTQVVSSTAPPHYAAELCQQPLFGFQGVFRAYSSACACASALGLGADAPTYVSFSCIPPVNYAATKRLQTKVYTKSVVHTVSRFKVLAVPLDQTKNVSYLNVKIGTLPQDGGSIPTHLTNSSEEASVFEFTVDHNLRLYHSELLAGTDREYLGNQVAGREIRYSSLHFGWSPTARLSKYLVPQSFIIDMQLGKVGYQLRTIVNATFSTDVVGVDDSMVVHLPVGDRRQPGNKSMETKELTTFYRLEAVELE